VLRVLAALRHVSPKAPLPHGAFASGTRSAKSRVSNLELPMAQQCGEIVCNGCTLHKEAVVDPVLGRTRVRVCLSCVCCKSGSASRPQLQQQHSYSSEHMSPHTASSGASARQWIQNHLQSPSSDDDSSEASDECSVHAIDQLNWDSADCFTSQTVKHSAFNESQNKVSNSKNNNAKFEAPRPAQPTTAVSKSAAKATGQNLTWRHAWPKPPVRRDESGRIDALHGLNILDTAPEKPFDMICELAKSRLSCPMAAVSFLDDTQQWFKASTGLAHKTIPRKIAFCTYTVYLMEPVVVLDTLKDARFERNPLVSGAAAVRFYAAAPIIERSTGHAVGSVFVLDTRPRESCDITVLERLAHAASENLPYCFDGNTATTCSSDDMHTQRMKDNNEDVEALENARRDSTTDRRLSAQIDALAALYGIDCSLTSQPENAKLSVSTASLSSAPSCSTSPLRVSPGGSSAETSLKECEAGAPPMEALLMRLLTQSTETQEQLTKQQVSISHMLGQHSSQIQRLMADLARMEAKMEAASFNSK
jgi:hypothetical protein